MIPRAAVLAAAFAIAAAPAAAETPSWSGSAAAYTYLMDDGFVSPVLGADRGALHLEARYQYEDRETVSLWAGRSFGTESTVALDVLAMAGVILGRTDGVAPGLEASLSWRSLELYSEAEYVFDLESDEGDFFYAWSQLGWQATSWLGLGLSAQRTRTYDRELSVERGVFATLRRGAAELSVFGFDPFGDEPFAILALSVDVAP